MLFLTEMQHQDMGEYLFLVRSPEGLAEGVFTVNMTYASGYAVEHFSSAIGPNIKLNFLKVLIMLILALSLCH